MSKNSEILSEVGTKSFSPPVDSTQTRHFASADATTGTNTAAGTLHKHKERRGAEAIVAADVRGTVEYRAAWDVELWKAIQAARLRRQLEEQKKKALAALAKFVKAKEVQSLEGCELREKAIVRREQRVTEEEKQIEKRKLRLVEMEKDLRRMRQQLADARHRAEAEAQAEIVRAKEDAAHTVALQEQRVQAAEAQTKRAEERLQQAQRDYLTLSEEFHRFRTRELVSPPEKTVAIEARMRAEFVLEQKALQERLERQHMEKEQQLARRCRELEEENKRLTASFTKRKEQLRHTASEVERLKALNKTLEDKLRLPAVVDATAADIDTTERKAKKLEEGAGSVQLPSSDVAFIAREIERLRRERRTILEGSAGAIDEDSDIVRCLDAKISDMVGQFYARGHSAQLIVD